MEKRTLYQRIAAWYSKRRASPGFLVLGTCILGAAIIAHDFYGWDPDWGTTNLGLSIEAFYNGLFLLMLFELGQKVAAQFQEWQKKQSERQMRHLERMERNMEGAVDALTCVGMRLKRIETAMGLVGSEEES